MIIVYLLRSSFTESIFFHFFNVFLLKSQIQSIFSHFPHRTHFLNFFLWKTYFKMEYPVKNFAHPPVSFNSRKTKKNKNIFVSFNNGHGYSGKYFPGWISGVNLMVVCLDYSNLRPTNLWSFGLDLRCGNKVSLWEHLRHKKVIIQQEGRFGTGIMIAHVGNKILYANLYRIFGTWKINNWINCRFNTRID